MQTLNSTDSTKFRPLPKLGGWYTFHPFNLYGMVCFSTNQCICDNNGCFDIPLQLTASLASYTFHGVVLYCPGYLYFIQNIPLVAIFVLNDSELNVPSKHIAHLIEFNSPSSCYVNRESSVYHQDSWYE